MLHFKATASIHIQIKTSNKIKIIKGYGRQNTLTIQNIAQNAKTKFQKMSSLN